MRVWDDFDIIVFERVFIYLFMPMLLETAGIRTGMVYVMGSGFVAYLWPKKQKKRVVDSTSAVNTDHSPEAYFVVSVTWNKWRTT